MMKNCSRSNPAKRVQLETREATRDHSSGCLCGYIKAMCDTWFGYSTLDSCQHDSDSSKDDQIRRIRRPKHEKCQVVTLQPSSLDNTKEPSVKPIQENERNQIINVQPTRPDRANELSEKQNQPQNLQVVTVQPLNLDRFRSPSSHNQMQEASDKAIVNKSMFLPSLNVGETKIENAVHESRRESVPGTARTQARDVLDERRPFHSKLTLRNPLEVTSTPHRPPVRRTRRRRTSRVWNGEDFIKVREQNMDDLKKEKTS